jgi:P2-related tail formation protein
MHALLQLRLELLPDRSGGEPSEEMKYRLLVRVSGTHTDQTITTANVLAHIPAPVERVLHAKSLNLATQDILTTNIRTMKVILKDLPGCTSRDISRARDQETYTGG